MIFYLDLSDKMTKIKASALRGQSKDELTKQLNEHKQVFLSRDLILWASREMFLYIEKS